MQILLMLHLPMKMIRKHELTKSNTNTADVTSAYRDDKQMQILSMLLLPMKMIKKDLLLMLLLHMKMT